MESIQTSWTVWFAWFNVFVFCGCCLIPCIRGLIVHTVDKSVSHQMTQRTIPDWIPPHHDVSDLDEVSDC